MAQEVEHILGKDEEVTLTLSAIPCDLIADRLIKSKSAAMAQEVEHILGKDEVTGSNPVSSSKATLNGVAFYIKSNYKKDEVTADARQSLAIPSPRSALLTNPVSSSKATLNGVAFYIKSNYKKDEVAGINTQIAKGLLALIGLWQIISRVSRHIGFWFVLPV